MEKKYVVFKREDFEHVLRKFSSGTGELALLGEVELNDAVVIRRQDVFAPPALDAYANAITLAAELLEKSGVDNDHHGLREIADYFHAQAALSWDTDRKLPD